MEIELLPKSFEGLIASRNSEVEVALLIDESVSQHKR